MPFSAIYTLDQSGDHTRQSLNGNLNAPGIVILDDIDFRNFKAQLWQELEGEPILPMEQGLFSI